MPIYAYKCASCGHAKDVLQKMSDAPLSVCPACGEATFQKQVTAAGFQLKGSGWYVTDFRNGNGGAAAAAPKAEGGSETKADGNTGSPAKAADGAVQPPAAAPAGAGSAATASAPATPTTSPSSAS